MATIGHTCVGLSLSCLSSAQGRGGRLALVWPGMMVLMAHLVDIVEWVVILAAPTYFDQHFVTNSPILTGGVVLVAWGLLATAGRLRRPWPFVLVAIAVFSHLVLDHGVIRHAIADVYRPSVSTEETTPAESIQAEAWSYGLLLVLALLARAVGRRDCPRKGRAAAGLLAAVAIFAALTRHPAAWVPAYVLAMAHALLLLRKAVTLRLAWGLVPMAPILALLATELYAGHLCKQGDALVEQADYQHAAPFYQRALEVPTRSRNIRARIYLSWCQRRTGDLEGAAATLRQTLRLAEDPGWPALTLAGLHVSDQAKGTPCYSPQEAVRLLHLVIDKSQSDGCRATARRLLDKVRQSAEGG